MKIEKSYKVCVCCFTYNHSIFIEHALDGFSMQKTSFPYVCCIVDDASTDGEANVINNYMENHFDLPNSYREETNDYNLTLAQHKTNENCFFVVILLKYNHYQQNKTKMPYLNKWCKEAPYFALCEGDDYWTNPLKLQKQVDFLERHPDYSMCHGDAEIYVHEKKWNKGRIGRIQSKAKSFDSSNRKEMFYRILTGEYPGIVTCTTCIRGDYFNNRVPDNRQFMMGDKPLWLDMSQKGRVKYFDEVFGVYVKHQGSATRTPNTRMLFTLNAHEMKIYYCEKYGYPIPPKIIKLYEKSYLALYFSGCEMPLMDIKELSNFEKKLGRIKANFLYKEFVKIKHITSLKWSIIGEKLNILFLFITNMVWKILKNDNR